MVRGVLDPEPALDERGDPRSGPKLVGPAVGDGAFLEFLRQLAQLLFIQTLGYPTGLCGQGVRAMLPDGTPPRTQGIVGHTEDAAHVGGLFALLEQFHGAAAFALKLFGGSFWELYR